MSSYSLVSVTAYIYIKVTEAILLSAQWLIESASDILNIPSSPCVCSSLNVTILLHHWHWADSLFCSDLQKSSDLCVLWHIEYIRGSLWLFAAEAGVWFAVYRPSARYVQYIAEVAEVKVWLSLQKCHNEINEQYGKWPLVGNIFWTWLKMQMKCLRLCLCMSMGICVWPAVRLLTYPPPTLYWICDLCFAYLCFFNVYFRKCVMCILLYDIKPKQNNLLLAVHMRSFPDCVQRN